METPVFISYWSETSERSLHQPLIIVTWSFSDLLLNRQAACSSEVSMACPANHQPPYWLRLCCVWFCSISRFVQGRSSKTEWGGHHETGNLHKQEIQLSQKQNKTGGWNKKLQKPVWNDICWPEQQKEALLLCRVPQLRNLIRVITKRKVYQIKQQLKHHCSFKTAKDQKLEEF